MVPCLSSVVAGYGEALPLTEAGLGGRLAGTSRPVPSPPQAHLGRRARSWARFGAWAPWPGPWGPWQPPQVRAVGQPVGHAAHAWGAAGPWCRPPSAACVCSCPFGARHLTSQRSPAILGLLGGEREPRVTARAVSLQGTGWRGPRPASPCAQGSSWSPSSSCGTCGLQRRHSRPSS